MELKADMFRAMQTYLRAELGAGSFHIDVSEELRGQSRNQEVFLLFYNDVFSNIHCLLTCSIHLFLILLHIFILKN